MPQSFSDWARSLPLSARPWVILGKGPSLTQRTTADLSGHFTLALNHAVCSGPVTVTHTIDVDVVSACAEAIHANARALVLPTRPHVGFRPSAKTIFEWAVQHPTLRDLDRQGRLLHYDLSSSPPRGLDPPIRARHFSAESAFELLARHGALAVRTLGVDGGTAYAPGMNPRTRLANGHSSYDLQTRGFAEILREHPIPFGPLDLDLPARIFVGADPAQYLAARVLEASLRRRSSISLSVERVDDVGLPVPRDPRNRSRTGFSFGRFRIPERCGFAGRALYLDADMLALDDVQQLWRLPFEAGHVLYAPQPPARRTTEHAVLLLDCAQLPWDAPQLMADLDAERLSYEDLLQRLVIVPPERRLPTLPPRWNVCEDLTPDAALVHFTDMPHQPWVRPGRTPRAQAWYRELRAAIRDGWIDLEVVRAEIARGHVSPALPLWANLPLPGSHRAHLRWTPPFRRASPRPPRRRDLLRARLRDLWSAR